MNIVTLITFSLKITFPHNFSIFLLMALLFFPALQDQTLTPFSLSCLLPSSSPSLTDSEKKPCSLPDSSPSLHGFKDFIIPSLIFGMCISSQLQSTLNCVDKVSTNILLFVSYFCTSTYNDAISPPEPHPDSFAWLWRPFLIGSCPTFLNLCPLYLFPNHTNLLMFL